MRTVKGVVKVKGTVVPVKVLCPDCGMETMTTEEWLKAQKGMKTCAGCRALLKVKL